MTELSPPPGVGERVSDLGIRVITLDYWANPDKADPAWLPGARKGYTSERQFRREMLRDWTVSAGIGVYTEDFDKQTHVAALDLAPNEGTALVGGMDFGLQPAAVIARVTDWGAIRVIRELVTWDGRGDPATQGADRFAELLSVVLRRKYPTCPVECIYADPNGWTRSQTDERTAASLVGEITGWLVVPGQITYEARRSAVRAALSKMWRGEPYLLISPSCPMLIEAMEGAYKYRESGDGADQILGPWPEKNAWSHVAEALEYLVSGLLTGAALEQMEPLEYEEAPAQRAGLYY